MPDRHADSPALYAIREVAEGCGISRETLRIWERRYGRPVPVRLPSGHRRYTEAQLTWLRRVAEALSRGHRPSDVVPLSGDKLDALLAKAADAPRGEPKAGEWVGLVRGFESPALYAHLLRESTARTPLEFLQGVIAPLLEAVGTGWADGWLDVRHEHFASEVVEDVLRDVAGRLRQPKGPPEVLLTTLPGETHGLGLIFLDLLCRARGVATCRLGVNSPLPEIASAVAETGVRVLGISVSLATGGVDTDRTLASLGELLPGGVRLVVGGAGARGVRRGPRGVEYLEDLAAWDALLAELGARPPAGDSSST